MNPLKKTLLAIVMAFAMPSVGMAGVSLSGTRLVFPGGEREASITVSAGNSESVFQNWLEADGAPEQDIPFTVVPSLARVNAEQGQIIRVLYQGTSLASDRETLYWLNVQEIPKVSPAFAEGRASGLSFTVRQRIKMFFRPKSVKTEPIAMTTKLKMQLSNNGKSLKIENAGANFITLVAVRTAGKNTNGPALIDAVMIPPFSTKEAPLNTAAAIPPRLQFMSLSDLGFSKKFEVILSEGKAVNPVQLDDDALPS